MTRRTNIQIVEELLARARRALGANTGRATVEEALRRNEQQPKVSGAARTLNQQRYLHQLAAHADIAVLGSKEMWR